MDAKGRARHSAAGYATATLGTLLIAALTLGTQPTGDTGSIPVTPCLWCDAYALRDFLLNILLFVPLGVGLGIARLRVPIALALIVAVTVGVEAAQLVLPGRDPNMRDLIANTLGGMAGMLAGRRWHTLLLPHPRRAWRHAAIARIVWVAVHLIAGWLLGPAAPGPSATVIAGTHVGGYSDFGGRVLRWNLAARTPDAPVTATVPGKAIAVAAAVIETGPRSEAMTPFITAVDSTGVFSFMLALEGDDLVMKVRTRADVARLRGPAFRFPDAVRPWYRTLPAPGNILGIDATRTSSRATIRVQTGTGTEFGGTVPVRTTQGWTLLSPSIADLSPGLDIASAVWCCLLLLPLGYWTATTNPYRRRMGWSLAAVAAGSGLIVGPLLFSLAYPAWLDIGASGGGLAAGALIAAIRRSHHR